MARADGTGRLARIKDALRAQRSSRSVIVRGGVAAATAAHRIGRFLVDGQYRSVVLLKFFNGGSVHQTSPDTWPDRYPRIFAACQAYFGDRRGLKILSYGCSTGEEVLTLRRYFPDAFITGAEINRRSLAICARREVDDRISFLYPEPAAIARRGPFDAIFCMAVLQRTPQAIKERGITSLKHIYPFEKFDRQIAELDGWLANGGLLVIRHAQYRLQDTAVARKYAALPMPALDSDGSPIFGRNSERLPDRDGATLAAIYVKARA